MRDPGGGGVLIEIRLSRFRMCKTLLNNGTNYQPQLVVGFLPSTVLLDFGGSVSQCYKLCMNDFLLALMLLLQSCT